MEAIAAVPCLLLAAGLVIQSFLLAVAWVQLQWAAFSAARVGAVRGADDAVAMEAAAAEALAWGPARAHAAARGFELSVPVPDGSGRPRPDGKEPFRDPDQSLPGLVQVRLTWRAPLLPFTEGASAGRWAARSRRLTVPLTATWSAPLETGPWVGARAEADRP